MDVVINHGESRSAPTELLVPYCQGVGAGGGRTREAGDWSDTLVLLLYSCRIISRQGVGGKGGGGGGWFGGGGEGG